MKAPGPVGWGQPRDLVEGTLSQDSVPNSEVHGLIYIVVPNGNAKSWYRSQPVMPAAVLQGWTSILGSGRAAMAAEVAAVVG